jgi:hypothetical protein
VPPKPNVPKPTPSFDYEAVALAGKLSDEHRRAIIESFASCSDVVAISTALGLPKDLVVEALSDPTLATEALEFKRNAMGLRFIGTAYDELLRLVTATDTRAAQRITAIKTLGGLLTTDFNPTEGASPSEGKPRRKRGVGGRHEKKEPAKGTAMVATLRKLAGGAAAEEDEDEDDG